MWGIPVLLGWVVAIPLIVARNNTDTVRKALVLCGVISSVWYVLINFFVPTQYDGYSVVSLTVSELSAIGASTRIIWILFVVPYILLLVAFGWGVLNSAADNRHLRIAGWLIIAYSVLNFYWPPMHQREVIAAGGGTVTDTLHIVWAMVTLLFNMLLMWFGAAAFGKQFRMYTVATWVIFIVFGVLTFQESPGIADNRPTPHIGLWERINMGAFLAWVVTLAITILRANKKSVSGRSTS